MKAKELCALAADWLTSAVPNAIIVTELSVAEWGGAMVDVAAIGETHIVGVEVKGEGDSPARLALQGLAYGMVVREMWILADASIQAVCHARRPPDWGRLEIWEGKVRPWNRATKLGEPIKRADGLTSYPVVRDDDTYDPDKARESQLLSPGVMCGALWRDELYNIVRRHQLRLGRSATVVPLREAIVRDLPVGIIHQEMIAELRGRAWRKPVRRQLASEAAP